jgi:hypothetical protein
MGNQSQKPPEKTAAQPTQPRSATPREPTQPRSAGARAPTNPPGQVTQKPPESLELFEQHQEPAQEDTILVPAPDGEFQTPAGRVKRIFTNLVILAVFTTVLYFGFLVFRFAVLEDFFNTSAFPEASMALLGLLIACAVLFAVSISKESEIGWWIFKLTLSPNTKKYINAIPPAVYVTLVVASALTLIFVLPDCGVLPVEFDVKTNKGLVTYPQGAEIEVTLSSTLVITAKSPSTNFLTCHWEGEGSILSSAPEKSSCKNIIKLNSQPGFAILTVYAKTGICRDMTVAPLIIESH